MLTRKKQAGIYGIVNAEAKAIYVGKSVHLVDRKSAHFGRLRRGKHDNGYLQRAWDKYGEEAFEFVILEVRVPPLLDAERYHSEVYKAAGYTLYNISGCGYGQECQSAETRAKISATMKGRERSPESVAQGAATQKGRQCSEETRLRMSLGQTGKKQPSEQTAKIAAANRGQKRTAEQRARMSAAMTGKPKILTSEQQLVRTAQLAVARARRWEIHHAAVRARLYKEPASV